MSVDGLRDHCDMLIDLMCEDGVYLREEPLLFAQDIKMEISRCPGVHSSSLTQRVKTRRVIGAALGRPLFVSNGLSQILPSVSGSLITLFSPRRQ